MSAPPTLGARAASGVVILVIRTVLVRAGGLLGLALLARLLTPDDFGTVAFALAASLSAGLLAEAGLGAALIRRREEPSPSELASASALQMALAGAVALLVAAVAAPFGRVGAVTALMVAPLPLLALRSAAMIVLERALDYGPLARVEVAETAAFYGTAIGSVALGAGVWGFAAAAAVRALVGVVTIRRLVPAGRVRPRFDRAEARRLLGFGARFQAVQIVQIGRDQSLNLIVAALAGLSGLGVWTIAMRLLQIPFVLFSSLWRVSFPAAARLGRGGAEIATLLERGVAVVGLATGVLLVPLVASASALVPLLFGPDWSDAALILPGLCLGLQISGPISVLTAGYLYAQDEAGAVLRSSIVAAIVWSALTAALIGPLGIAAIGLAGLVGALGEAIVLARAATRCCGARLLWPLIGPTLAAVSAALLGRLITDATTLADPLAAPLAAAAALALQLVLARLLAPAAFAESRRAITGLIGRRHRPYPTKEVLGV